MSHERMLKAEKELKERSTFDHRAGILDAQEDQRYGEGSRGSELPDELRDRKDRLARIRQTGKKWKPRPLLPQSVSGTRTLEFI